MRLNTEGPDPTRNLSDQRFSLTPRHPGSRVRSTADPGRAPPGRVTESGCGPEEPAWQRNRTCRCARVIMENPISGHNHRVRLEVRRRGGSERLGPLSVRCRPGITPSRALGG
eukprot:762717-Hanusia_phi.AAC.1